MASKSSSSSKSSGSKHVGYTDKGRTEIRTDSKGGTYYVATGSSGRGSSGSGGGSSGQVISQINEQVIPEQIQIGGKPGRSLLLTAPIGYGPVSVEERRKEIISQLRSGIPAREISETLGKTEVRDTKGRSVTSPKFTDATGRVYIKAQADVLNLQELSIIKRAEDKITSKQDKDIKKDRSISVGRENFNVIKPLNRDTKFISEGITKQDKDIVFIETLKDPLGALNRFYEKTFPKTTARPLNIYNTQTGIFNPNAQTFEVKTITPTQAVEDRNIYNLKRITTDINKANEELGKRVSVEAMKPYEIKIDELQKGYQEQINTGKISLDQAQLNFNKDVENFNIEYQKSTKNLYNQRFQTELQPIIDFKQSYNLEKSKAKMLETIPSPAPVLTAGTFVLGTLFAPYVTYTAGLLSGFGGGLKAISEKKYFEAGLSFGFGALSTYGLVKTAGYEVTLAKAETIFDIKTPTNEVRYSLPNRDSALGIINDKFYFKNRGNIIAQKSTSGTLTYERDLANPDLFNVKGGITRSVTVSDFLTEKPITFQVYNPFIAQGQVIGQGDLIANLQNINKRGFFIFNEKLTPSLFNVKSKTGFTYTSSSNFGGDKLGTLNKIKGEYGKIFKIGGETRPLIEIEDNSILRFASGKTNRLNLKLTPVQNFEISSKGIKTFPETLYKINQNPQTYNIENFGKIFNKQMIGEAGSFDISGGGRNANVFAQSKSQFGSSISSYFELTPTRLTRNINQNIPFSILAGSFAGLGNVNKFSTTISNQNINKLSSPLSLGGRLSFKSLSSPIGSLEQIKGQSISRISSSFSASSLSNTQVTGLTNLNLNQLTNLSSLSRPANQFTGFSFPSFPPLPFGFGLPSKLNFDNTFLLTLPSGFKKRKKKLSPSLVSVGLDIRGKLKPDITGFGTRFYPKGIKNPYKEFAKRFRLI